MNFFTGTRQPYLYQICRAICQPDLGVCSPWRKNEQIRLVSNLLIQKSSYAPKEQIHSRTFGLFPAISLCLRCEMLSGLLEDAFTQLFFCVGSALKVKNCFPKGLECVTKEKQYVISATLFDRPHSQPPLEEWRISCISPNDPKK